MRTFISRFGWLIVGTICLIGGIYLAIAVHFEHILPMDTTGYDWIAAHLIRPSLTPIVLLITRFASAAILIAISVILLVILWIRQYPLIGIAIPLNLIAIALINQIIKNIMQRPRPSVPHLAVEHGYSFPSGHAMAATAFYGFLIYLTYRYLHNRVAKIIIIIALVLLIPTIMFTRVYLGVHYVSDVLAGCLFSIAYLTIIWIPLMEHTLLADSVGRAEHAQVD